MRSRCLEFFAQPFKHFQLICCRGAANLDKQLLQIGPGPRDVGCTFVAHRADSAQIGWFVASPQAFVDDVPDVQTRFACGIVRMGFSGNGATHLASEAVAIENVGPGFLGYLPCKSGLWLGRFEQILSGLEVGPVIVREDLVTLFSAQLANSPCPFANASGHRAQLLGLEHLADMVQKEKAQLGTGAIGGFGAFCHATLRCMRWAAAASIAIAMRWLTAWATGGGTALPT